MPERTEIWWRQAGQDCGERTEKSVHEPKDVDFRIRPKETEKALAAYSLSEAHS